jgi:phage protein D/phage baseplate assembly protein gpV
VPESEARVSQFTLKIDGTGAPQEVMDDLVQVEVDQNLHLPAMFSITLAFGNLKWLEEQTLREGKKIEIAAKEGSAEKKLCSGKIATVEADLVDDANPTVTLRGYDESHVMHRRKCTKPFLQVKDSDIASRVAGQSGLSSEVDATSGVHEYVLQTNESDYELLRRRAERIGYEFFVNGGKLYFKRPGSFKRPEVSLEWGVNLKSFRPRLATTEQVNEVEVRGWDPKQKREIIGRANSGQGAPQIGENRKGGDIANQVWGNSKVVVVDRPVTSQAEADTIAKAELDQVVGSFVEAEGTCFGDAAIQPGCVLDIKGVGRRFSGKYRVSQARHTYDKTSGYMTSFAVCGQRAGTLLELVKEKPRRVGTGVAVGLVTNVKDPDDAGRIKVQYNWLGDQIESNWMRVASVSAGGNRGLYFLPEVGDEVLVAFEHGDVHAPIVVGSLWNGKNPVPEKNSKLVAGDGTVSRRIIRSRTGHMVILDDSDSSPGITIVDKTGSNKLVIDSKNNAMKIEIGGNLDIQIKGKITIKGNQLQIEGQTTAEIKSGTGMKIDGGAKLDVKGGIINLN